MPRLQAGEHIAPDPACAGIVKPVAYRSVLQKLRDGGIAPIGVVEDRRPDIDTLDVILVGGQSQQRVLAPRQQRRPVKKVIGGEDGGSVGKVRIRRPRFPPRTFVVGVGFPASPS